MKNFIKYGIALAATVILSLTCGIFACAASDEPSYPKLDGEVSRTVEELYDGVYCTHITLGSSSKYGQQELWITEFDPKQSDLTVDVTGIDQYSSTLATVSKTAKAFNKNNDSGKNVISAINGDLWMVTYAHARVEGSGTEYGGCSDAVVTDSLTLPRGLDIYDGEIISSPHSRQETPYEGAFQSFGFLPDGTTVLGQPKLTIVCDNLTTPLERTIKLSGLNRLPADDAIYLYSDKGTESTNSLDDAYEIVIDCGYDYKITSGAVITGKITAICKSGDKNPTMKENRLILCARGSYIEKISGFKVGDELSFSFKLSCSTDNDLWQNVTNAVGGHMMAMYNGKQQNLPDSTNYPATIIGNTADGKVMFLVNDGRQSGYSLGFKIEDMPEVCNILGYENAFFLDGGGSTAMVNLNEDGDLELQNKPSDGAERSVVNTVILSYVKGGADKTNPSDKTSDTTAAPAEVTEVPVETEDTSQEDTSGESAEAADATEAAGETGQATAEAETSGCGSSLNSDIAFVLIISFITGTVLIKRKNSIHNS